MDGNLSSIRIARRRQAAFACRVAYRHLTASRMGVHDPLFNLREIAKNLILLEDHLSHPYKICPDCVRKHLLCIEGLAEEAVTLDPGERFSAGMEGLAERARQWLEEFTDGGAPFDLACKMRQIRKKIVPLSFDPRGMQERVALLHIARRTACFHQ